MILWYSSNAYSIITSTNPYYFVHFHTTVQPRKYYVSVYQVPYFNAGRTPKIGNYY